MFSTWKKIFKWRDTGTVIKSSESTTVRSSLLLAAFIGILEDVLFWKHIWLSSLFIFLLNMVFLVCIQCQINLIQFILSISIVFVIFDAFERWLKYKHRNTFLKTLAEHDGKRLKAIFKEIKEWIGRRCSDIRHLHETNQTKAFLVVNGTLFIMLLLCHYVGGYLILYIFCMFVCFAHKIIMPVQRFINFIQYDIESDAEFENFIPKASEVDLKLLSIEHEPSKQSIEDKQPYESWKPEDLPIEEASDSSENSSSIETNFSINTIHTLDKDVEASDSSEDEYIPLDQQSDKLQLKSTLKVVEPQSSWSSSAYNTIWNLGGAMANIINLENNSVRKRISSKDSSDSFEMLDDNDL